MNTTTVKISLGDTSLSLLDQVLLNAIATKDIALLETLVAQQGNLSPFLKNLLKENSIRPVDKDTSIEHSPFSSFEDWLDLVEVNATQYYKLYKVRLVTIDAEELVEKCIKYFQGKKTAVGTMGDKEAAIPKMKAFLKAYPEFDKDTIVKACRTYVEDHTKDDYKFLRKFNYFIKKDKLSDLLDYCDSVKNSRVKGSSNRSNYGQRVI